MSHCWLRFKYANFFLTNFFALLYYFSLVFFHLIKYLLDWLKGPATLLHESTFSQLTISPAWHPVILLHSSIWSLALAKYFYTLRRSLLQRQHQHLTSEKSFQEFCVRGSAAAAMDVLDHPSQISSSCKSYEQVIKNAPFSMRVHISKQGKKGGWGIRWRWSKIEMETKDKVKGATHGVMENIYGRRWWRQWVCNS